MKLYAPWEKSFKKISTPFEEFLHTQTTSGLVLMCMTVLALVLANSSYYDAYSHILHTYIEFNVGSWEIKHSLHHWINDGLMAIFFFIIGLEIKREVTAGELSDIKAAILPIIAAIGGMVFPAIIYTVINSGGPGAAGWGIPMATDIAFAISAVVLLGKRVPPALVTFLVALAIVDDLGAVLVIALFYTDTINFLSLGLAGAMLLTLITFNRFGIHKVSPYVIIGVFMWFFMLESGIHATIAGILVALAIPSVPKKAPLSFAQYTKDKIAEFEKYPICEDHNMNEKQKHLLTDIKDKVNDVGTPAARLEHDLHLPVALLIIPIFALANAGVKIDFSSIGTTIMEPVSLGIIAGLILGKVIGIFGVSWVAVKLGIANLPENSTMSQVLGVAFLAGIGFTMSIFVADLAFLGNPDLVFQAKVGILSASLFSGLFGYFWLKSAIKKEV